MDGLANPIEASATAWHEGKLFIEHFTDICHDTLHLIAGTAIWIALVALGRRAVDSLLPLLLTLALALLNEAVDLWVEQWPSPGMQWGEGARDVAATIAIPMLLTLAARWTPWAFTLSGGRANGVK